MAEAPDGTGQPHHQTPVPTYLQVPGPDFALWISRKKKVLDKFREHWGEVQGERETEREKESIDTKKRYFRSWKKKKDH